MAGRIFSGLLTRRSYFSSVHGLNLWGRFSRCSYSTAKKLENISKEKILLTEEDCRIHNQNIPTYEQVKKDPNLQQELAQMYKELADDPDFQEVTRHVMEMGRLKFKIKS